MTTEELEQRGNALLVDEEQMLVKEFMEKFGQTINDKPTAPNALDRMLRVRLIMDELRELAEASGVDLYFIDGEPCYRVLEGVEPDMVKVADAFADLAYVVKGGPVTWGIGLWPIFLKVHQKNMEKIGGHKDKDGKWVKPAGFVGPEKDIEMILTYQGWEKKPCE